MKKILFFCSFLIIRNVNSFELCNYPNTDLCLGFSTKIPKVGTWIQVKSRLGAILKNSTIPQWTLKNITLALPSLNLTLEGDKYAKLGANSTNWAYFHNRSIHYGENCLTIMQCQAEGKPFCNPRSEQISLPGGKAKKGSYLQWKPCSFIEAQTFVINPPCSPKCARKFEGTCKKSCLTKYCLKGKNITCTSSPTSNNTTSSPTLPLKGFPTYHPTHGENLPTYKPTRSPTLLPTFLPSSQPTQAPSLNPFLMDSPTLEPTIAPSNNPTTKKPTSQPLHPSKKPTMQPSRNPTYSKNPTGHPLPKKPSSQPTNVKIITVHPSTSPKKITTISPSASPKKITTISPSFPKKEPLSYEWIIIISLSVFLGICTLFLAVALCFICVLTRQRDNAGVFKEQPPSPPAPLPPLDINHREEGEGEEEKVAQ